MHSYRKRSFILCLIMAVCWLSMPAIAQSSLTFGSQAVGTASAPQTIPLSNSSSVFIDISIAVNTLDFHIGPGTTCPINGTLGSNSSCNLTIVFAPIAVGSRTGTATITTLGCALGCVPQTIFLSGTGVTAPAPTPTPLPAPLPSAGTPSGNLTISFADPLGDNTGPIDVTGMLMTFNNGTGNYSITLSATNTNPFVGQFLVAVALFNPDAPATESFFDRIQVFNMSSATTSLVLTGNNAHLLAWGAGNRVATNTEAGLGNPLGDPPAIPVFPVPFSFRTTVSSFPLTFLTNEDAIAFGPAGVATIRGNQAFTSFTNRQAWLQAVSGQITSTIDFEGIAPGGGFTFFDTPSGLTLSGVNFEGIAPSNTQLPFYLRVVDPLFGPAFYDWGSGAILHGPPVPVGPQGEGGPNSHIHVTLPKGVTSFGTDIMSILQYASAFEVTVSTAGGTSRYQVPSLTHPNRAFVGFVSPIPIDSVDLAASNGFPILDNFSFAPTPSRSFAYETNFASSNVSAYAIDPLAGTLTAVPGSPFSAGSGSIAVAVDPSSRFAYVANWFGDSVSAYTINPVNGALTPILGSPFPAGLQPFALTVDPAGSFLYVVNASSNNLSVYAIDGATGVLSPIPGSPFPVGTLPNSVKIDPSGKFLYVTNRNSNDVSAFAINSLTGGLTPIAGSPFPTPVTPQAIAIDHKSAFAYIANCSDGITAYSINSATGALTPIPGSPFPAGFCPWWITLDPSGQFAFVANAGGSVSAFRVDPVSGALASATGSPFPAGGFPASIAVDPTGTVVLVSNNTDGNVGTYRINPANGALTLIGTSPAGAQPGSLAITSAIITANGSTNTTMTTGVSCGATDVSSQVRVVRSGMNYLPFSTYEYSESITVSNTGPAILGPLYLVLDGLPTSSKGLLGNQLVTHCGTTSTMGSYLIPLVFNLVGGELPQGGSTGVPLVFASQDPSGIAYTTRVLSGTPNK